MKTTYKIAASLLCSSLLVLGGCSTLSKDKHANANQNQQNPQVVDADGAVVNGLGSDSEFSSRDRNTSTALVAPHNQTYHFAFDDSRIEGADKASLDAQANYLAKHPNAYILITGNTDERGSREYNIALGERRGNRVAQYLKARGVRSQQIRTVSYGQEKPVAMGHNEDAYRLNRRAELIYEATS